MTKKRFATFIAMLIAVAMILPSCSGINPDAINPKFDQDFGDAAGNMGEIFTGDYIGYLGYGYNVVGSGYFNSGDVSAKAEWLDVDAMVKANLIYTKAISDTKYATYSGETLKEFQQSVSNKVGLQFSYGLFSKVSGEFSISTSSSSSVTQKSVFIKNQIILKRERQFIKTSNLTLAQLKNYVNKTILDQFEADTSKKSEEERYKYYKDLFINYGTHIMIDILNGGRMDLNYVYNNKDSKTLSEIEASVNLAYSAVSGSISGSADTKTTTAINEFVSNTTFQCHRVGGTIMGDIFTYDKAREAYPAWSASISEKDTLALVDLGDNAMTSLIPVWDLVDNTKKASVIKAFEDYLAETGSLFADIDKRVHNIEPEYYIHNIYIGSNKPSNRAITDLIAKITKAEPNTKYEILLQDLNEGADGDYIYIGYTLTTDPSKAITGLGMNWWDKEGDIKNTLKQNNLEYQIIRNDLNRNARGKWVFLFSTKDPAAGKPIKKIGVENNGKLRFTDGMIPPLGWEAVFSIPNPNERIDCNKGCGSKTDDIFLWFTR